MNRRNFALGTLASATCMSRLARTEVQRKTVVSVQDANAAGLADATSAFRAALARLPRQNAHLIIPAGVYSFHESDEVLLSFKNFTGLTIDGNGVTLNFAGNTRPFAFEDCARIAVRNLTINWPRPPYSQGEVIEAAPQMLRLRVDREYRHADPMPIGAIGEYDRGQSLMSVNGLDLYGEVRSAVATSEDTLRIDLNSPVALRPGATLVLRHRVYGVNALIFRRCNQVEVADIHLLAAPGMGIVAADGRDYVFRRIHVHPPVGSDRLMSLNADAIHLTDCGGPIEISECDFFGMGDDAINICSSMLRITRVRDASTWVVRGKDSDSAGTWPIPARGAALDLYDGQSLKKLGEAIAIGSEVVAGEVILQMQTRTAVREGMLFCNPQADSTTRIHHCAFRGNRARAILAHQRVEIRNCTFHGQSLAAILLAPDPKWMEGPLVDQAQISANSFDFSYYGQCAFRRGAITVDTMHDPWQWPLAGVAVNRAVRIFDNDFHRSHGPAIFINRTEEVATVKGQQVKYTIAEIHASSIRRLSKVEAADDPSDGADEA